MCMRLNNKGLKEMVKAGNALLTVCDNMSGHRGIMDSRPLLVPPPSRWVLGGRLKELEREDKSTFGLQR